MLVLEFVNIVSIVDGAALLLFAVVFLNLNAVFRFEFCFAFITVKN